MKWDDPKISEILRLEYEITRALIAGHKAQENDQYQEYRKLLKKLRLEANVPTHAQQQLKPQNNKG